MTNAINNQAKIVGIHTFRAYDTSSLEAKGIEYLMGLLVTFRSVIPRTLHRTAYRALLARLQAYKTREMVVHNLVATVGRSVIAQRLANVTTYTGVINYGALGSSTTAPANGDTQLGTEVFRKVVASSSYTSNVAFVDFFYSKADTSGTYQEFGTFIDGTGSANSGKLFTHALTGGWTKSSSESMTVSCQYTIS